MHEGKVFDGYMGKIHRVVAINDEIASNDIKALFAITWDEFSQKYNYLSSKVEELGVDSNLLDEIIVLKSELVKLNIMIKMDDLFKV